MLIGDVLFNNSSDMIFYTVHNSACKVTLFFRDVQEKTLFGAIFYLETDESTISGTESTFVGTESTFSGIKSTFLGYQSLRNRTFGGRGDSFYSMYCAFSLLWR